MKKLAAAIAAVALVGTPAFAQAPPPVPAPVPTWTGFYGGIQFGGGWSDEAVNYSPNDPIAAGLVAGTGGFVQPLANVRVPQSGLVGGFEAGYNWQWSNWVVGLETDFSFSGMDGRATGTSIALTSILVVTHTIDAEQSTDWYGTVRGRAGWLATPNLLLFGTGGFAYGRASGSANLSFSNPTIDFSFPFSFICTTANVPCFAGSSSSVRTGWTAGGGAEWLLDQHWSAKIEYQFVDLGTETVRVTGTLCPVSQCGITTTIPASFNAFFRDQFNVVRLGLNYRFW